MSALAACVYRAWELVRGRVAGVHIYTQDPAYWRSWEENELSHHAERLLGDWQEEREGEIGKYEQI